MTTPTAADIPKADDHLAGGRHVTELRLNDRQRKANLPGNRIRVEAIHRQMPLAFDPCLDTRSI
jgi:hypothetical protein